MATGRPDSSDATTTTDSSVLKGTLASPLPQIGGTIETFNNLSWSNVRTLPPLRRFSEAQIPTSWPLRASQISPPITLPYLDTRQDSHSENRNDAPPLKDQISHKRRRIERFGERRIPDSPPKPDAESPPTLHASYGHSANLVPFSPQLSQKSDAREDIRPFSTRQYLAWEAHAEPDVRDVDCCRPGCVGSSCRKLRSMLQDLISEITRDPLDHSAPSIGHPPPKPISRESVEIGSPDALEWAIQRLRWNNSSLRTLVSIQAGEMPEPPPLFRRTPTPPFGSPTAGMKRQYDGSEKAADFSSRRNLQRSGGPSSLTGSQPEDNWRTLEAMDPPNHPSYQHRRLSSFSSIPPFDSPTQASQAARTLPSPSSLKLHIPLNLGSGPQSVPSSAQSAHLQDLQHQVSVKTLALQTLQREYDSLLQKLERQRVRSGALEKKFEVSDAEIKSLNEEKEQLTEQVQRLEMQVDELQKTRDEARRMGSESASQYMKIVEMADRLQGKSVEDKKAWDKERQLLSSRLRELEQREPRSPANTKDVRPPQPSEQGNPGAASGNSESRLQWEVHRLKERIATLETSLQSAKNESQTIREAALTLVGCGQRIDAAVDAGFAKNDERRL